jgi:hypothetical protein
MAVIRVYMRAGDLHPPLDVTFRDQDGNALNMSAATALVFTMSDIATGTVVLNEVAASWRDQDAGQARYTWAAGNTDTESDGYDCRFKATISGKQQSAPSRNDQLILVIGRD